MRIIKKSAEENQRQEGQPIVCACNGCGLAGTFSVGTKGEMPFYCRFHFGKEYTKNHLITDAIHQNKDLLNLADICAKPEMFFKGDKNITFFKIANQVLQDSLDDLGLSNLYFENNLLKTRNKIMSELDARIGKVA